MSNQASRAYCGDCGLPLLPQEILTHDCPERRARLEIAQRETRLILALAAVLAVGATLAMGGILIWLCLR